MHPEPRRPGGSRRPPRRRPRPQAPAAWPARPRCPSSTGGGRRRTAGATPTGATASGPRCALSQALLHESCLIQAGLLVVVLAACGRRSRHDRVQYPVTLGLDTLGSDCRQPQRLRRACARTARNRRRLRSQPAWPSTSLSCRSRDASQSRCWSRCWSWGCQATRTLRPALPRRRPPAPGGRPHGSLPGRARRAAAAAPAAPSPTLRGAPARPAGRGSRRRRPCRRVRESPRGRALQRGRPAAARAAMAAGRGNDCCTGPVGVCALLG